MRRALIVASIAWVALLAIALAARLAAPQSLLAAAVYGFCSLICHQRPDRSFVTASVQWPVCGRCAGLYLSVPIGAILAWWRGAAAASARANLVRLTVAAIPTAVTVVIEYGGFAPVSSVARALAALPLGAAIAFTLVAEAPGARARIG